MDSYEEAASYGDQIEKELRAIGVWQSQPPPPAAFESKQAFFSDTMTFYQWLQFVLLARVRAIVASRGEFPDESSVGTYAVRQLDGESEAGKLTDVLCEFDYFIDRLGGATE